MMNVTLRAGTKFSVEYPDGTLSAPQLLHTDEQVRLVAPGVTFNVYENKDGMWLYVEAANEVR